MALIGRRLSEELNTMLWYQETSQQSMTLYEGLGYCQSNEVSSLTWQKAQWYDCFWCFVTLCKEKFNGSITASQ